MVERDTDFIVKRITEWQNNPLLHPLTCGINSRHQLLQPVVHDEKVLLECPDCDYLQTHIPDVVLELDHDQYHSIMEKIHATRKRPR